MFYMLFCTWVIPLEYTKLSHIAKLEILVTNLVLSSCFVTRLFSQTNKYKTKSFIIKVLTTVNSTSNCPKRECLECLL